MYGAMALIALLDYGDDRWMTPEHGWMEDRWGDGRRCWYPDGMWYVYDAHSQDAELVMAGSEREAARRYAQMRGRDAVEVYVVQPVVLEVEPGARYEVHIPDHGVGTTVWPGG